MEIKELKAVDFFCGSGGMTYGLSQAGIKVLAGIDIDGRCKQTYEINNNPAVFLEKDVTKFSPPELNYELGVDKFDDSLILVGCSPCQYWSRVNTMRYGASATMNLLEDFQRFVSYFKPGYVLIENVPGILSRNTRNQVLINFLDYLNLNGYNKNHFKIINVSRYGVPQTRKRFVLLATRLNHNISLPSEQKVVSTTVRNFIGQHNGFPSIPDGYRDTTDFMHTSARLSERNRQRIRMTDLNGGTRVVWGSTDLQIDTYRGKDNSFRDVYGRMYWDKPAPTITTRFNSLSCGRFGHPEEHRAISLREGATLQTFPKAYIFKGNQASIAKQIGNAVPPELARRIGITILQHWEKECQVLEQKQEQLTY